MEMETFKPSEKSRSGTTKNLQSPAEKSANRQTILPQIAKLNVTIFSIRPRKISSLFANIVSSRSGYSGYRPRDSYSGTVTRY